MAYFAEIYSKSFLLFSTAHKDNLCYLVIIFTTWTMFLMVLSSVKPRLQIDCKSCIEGVRRLTVSLKPKQTAGFMSK